LYSSASSSSSIRYGSVLCGDRPGPAPGFFPFYLGVGVVISSLFVFSKAFAKYKKEGAGKPLMPPGAIKPILWVLIPSLSMVVITEFVGSTSRRRCFWRSTSRRGEDRVGHNASGRHHLATVALHRL